MSKFDVFLAHSSKDKPLIRQICRQLKARGLNPWLDEEEIAPGTKFQDEIQQAIGQINTAAICIGPGNLGRWQALELKAFISQCVERDIPVIPVLLPGVAGIPEGLLFLREFHGVWFQDGIEDARALFQLEWGITGIKPTPAAPERETPLPPEDDLSSEKGVDYRTLQKLLKVGQWKEADRETADRMCEVMGRQKEGWLQIEDIEAFPCKDLRTIDQLWVKYSNGYFGFSVQKKIWQNCGSPTKLGKNWDQFCEAVGWKGKGKYEYVNYSDLKFNPSNSLKGELPRSVPAAVDWVRWSRGSLLSRSDL